MSLAFSILEKLIELLGSKNSLIELGFKLHMEEFTLLEPNKNETISLENIKATSMKNATNAMESHILDFFGSKRIRRHI
ncbi:hypothetical protein Ahy_A03g016145 isoform A [Arachis hypogaea]|nr:hypothetical protein Ahy_A03g016145 isoform A [Arachis hypogaea]